MRPFPLRPFQAKTLHALEKNAHVLCVAPTGSGKSLIYEKEAQKTGTRSLLVSPLIALARQQRDRLETLRIPVSLAAGPHPQPPPSERTGIWIISPERLMHPTIQQTLRDWKPGFLIVDECHCFWDWGDHFRPAFRKLPELLIRHRIPKSLWLTATLPWEARNELRKALPEPRIEIGEFALPPGLRISVEQVPWFERVDRLVRFLERQTASGIIFVQTRKTAERLLRLLRGLGKSCVHYHAGLSSEERRNTEGLIARQLPQIIVATSAFGMGMDHPYLKWALLWQAPSSLLSLAQAIGRAGRDHRNLSEARIFWDAEDFHLLEWTLRGSPKRRQELLRTRQFLRCSTCRSSDLQTYFNGCAASTRCHQCDLCLNVSSEIMDRQYPTI